MRTLPNRRAIMLGALASTSGALSGCAALRDMPIFGDLFEHWPRDGSGPVRTPDYAKIYGPIGREAIRIPAFDYTVMDPEHLRTNVAYTGVEPPGTLVVEPGRNRLYLVETKGRATRFGIGIGREAAGWSGTAVVQDRRVWPDLESVAAVPAASYTQLGLAGSAAGRAEAPRGARSLGLFSEGRDTGFRIHGTASPESIGGDQAAGCVCLINQDIIHLYRRAPDGTQVVVLA